MDLGFGDAGKGTIVDYLVRARNARWVVRFNGGAQAGHNVVTDDGRHHTFSQIGSGTFAPQVRTHLSRYCVIHPTALLVEARRIAKEAGVTDALRRLTISEEALVTTPFVQSLGRLRELARENDPHGTCGAGVGETMLVAQQAPDLAIRMVDLGRLAALRRRLEHLRQYALAQADRFDVDDRRARWERDLIANKDTCQAWMTAIKTLLEMNVIVGREHLPKLLSGPEHVVFEGAQGVLLDRWRGLHPHTTWSNCTTENALALLQSAGYDGQIQRIGVLRSYQTRHGHGPMPTHQPALQRLPERHNNDAGWQGCFRRGWLDLPLTRYALACCPVDGLALTHLDCVTPGWCVCTDYDGVDTPLAVAADLHNLQHVEALGIALATCARPYYEPVPHNAFPAYLERALGTPVLITSFGPTAGAKHEHTSQTQNIDLHPSHRRL